MLVFAAVIAAACTFASVKPQTIAVRPKQPPAVLILGEIGVADKLWETYRLHFLRGAETWARRNAGFREILVERPAQVPTDAVVLVGTITEMEKGSAALRFFVGMGAGQARARGVFELQGPQGQSYVRFTSHESYLGGAGIGGAGLLDMEDIFQKFGETVAKTVAKWSRGEPLEQ
jgi:hypothetical protein